MPDVDAAALHISSAVILAMPGRCAQLARRLAALPNTEVPYVHEGRIVVVFEAESSDVIGGRLAAIASMDGVLAANLVFEQVETLDQPTGAP